MEYSQFSKVVFLDFEFRCPKGDNIRAVHCLVAMELYSGEIWKYDAEQLSAMTTNPLPTGDDVLYVGYAVSAEWQCFLKLGWDIPENVVDLRYEFLRWRNGNAELPKPEKGVARTGLLFALRVFNVLTTTDSQHKSDMRQLCIDNDILPTEHRQAVIDYCEEDVRPLPQLLNKLLPTAGAMSQVLFRGRYAEVEASCSSCGIPMDTENLEKLVGNSKQHIAKIAEESSFDFFMPSGEISQRKFASYLITNDMPWERTAGDLLATDADTLKESIETYPQMAEAYEVVRTKALLQDLSNLPVGSDGRCRYFQNCFGTVTGRHAASQNPFSMKRWIRYLIQPTKGKAFVSADWKSQEIGIAGYLSNDANMKEVFQAAVEGGDVYMRFAELAGLVPSRS